MKIEKRNSNHFIVYLDEYEAVVYSMGNNEWRTARDVEPHSINFDAYTDFFVVKVKTSKDKVLFNLLSKVVVELTVNPSSIYEIFNHTGFSIKQYSTKLLTEDVFNRKDCPVWARYAAVNESGTAYWFGEKPRYMDSVRSWSADHIEAIPEPYNMFDYTNSCVERENSPVYSTEKLTVEVFSRSDCPEWAQYAAVDANGMAYWYAADNKPSLSSGCKQWLNSLVGKAQLIGNFSPFGWRNTLIERPNKICTVGVQQISKDLLNTIGDLLKAAASKQGKEEQAKWH